MSVEAGFALFTVVMFAANWWLWERSKAILAEAKSVLADAQAIQEQWIPAAKVQE